MNNIEKVYTVVRKIPKGKVATYGQIAKLSGIKSPRLVGSMLHKNIDPVTIPCHRVVNSKGKLALRYAFGGITGQKEKLRSEGITTLRDVVDLQNFLWKI